jgi:RNA polymerase sigma-70 factor (ECF subfamily)
MPAMMTTVEGLWEAGRAAWPGVPFSAEAFAHHLALHLDEGEDLSAVAYPSDLFLAGACAAGEPQALAAFERRYLAEVPAHLSRIDATPAFVDEVRQVLRERLFVGQGGARPKVADYSGRGALGSWVRVTTIRTALSLRRGAHNRGHDSEPDSAELLITPDPELHYIKSRYRREFEQAFKSAFDALQGQERTVLRLHFLDGLSIDRIGELYGVHRATVARWIAASRQTLLERTRTSLHERLRLGPGEFESLMGLIQSQLDVSLHGVLRSRT